MRHQKDGFQKNIKNDLYMVEEQLQAYDPHLYIMYSTQKQQWLIMDGLLETAIMRLPQQGFETLDSRVVDHIKKIHTANGFSALHEVLEAEAKREKEEQRILDDVAHDYAREMKDALVNASYGITEGHQKYVQVTK